MQWGDVDNPGFDFGGVKARGLAKPIFTDYRVTEYTERAP